MLSLVLAAWPREIRPRALDDISIGLFQAFGSVGIRAGMAVFIGSRDKKRLIVRSECVLAEGTDSQGRVSQLYPIKACPPKGLRWKPVIYDHMILHWTWEIRQGVDSPNLWAMGDHFCNALPGRSFATVKIKRVFNLIDYQTGEESSLSMPVGSVRCRR